jgi:hypothetical protein
MPPTNGMSAQGTIIERAPAATPGVFAMINELRDITAPAFSRNPIEMTTHNEGDDEYRPGIRRKGDLTFNVNYVPDDPTIDHETGLLAGYQNGDIDTWRLVYPDGSRVMFSGFVSNFGVGAPVDDRLSADVTVRPTGGHIWDVIE